MTLPLQPGRELDALVAEKVMGLDPKWFNVSVSYYEAQCEGPRLKAYSRDIAAAWEVLEHLAKRPHLITSYSCNWMPPSSRYLVIIQEWFSTSEMMKGSYTSDYTETAPHAICLAALKAVGVEV